MPIPFLFTEEPLIMMERKCLECGKKFVSSQGLYCSKSCYSKAKEREAKFEIPIKKEDKISVISIIKY